ncbi:MAG: NAD(P)-dependent oxidoreductase, partial [Nitrosopumilus sp.]
MLEGKRVFVSGGNGVIGNELIPQLHEQGAIVLVGDLKPRPIEWPEDIIYRQGDLNYITKDELCSFKPEYFFHLAATFERSIETYYFWEENYRHNIKLSNHLTSLLKDSDYLIRFVFASSYLIYDPVLYTFDQPTKKA